MVWEWGVFTRNPRVDRCEERCEFCGNQGPFYWQGTKNPQPAPRRVGNENNLAKPRRWNKRYSLKIFQLSQIPVSRNNRNLNCTRFRCHIVNTRGSPANVGCLMLAPVKCIVGLLPSGNVSRKKMLTELFRKLLLPSWCHTPPNTFPTQPHIQTDI